MDLRLTLKAYENYVKFSIYCRKMDSRWHLGKGTAASVHSTSGKVRCRNLIAGLCCCLLFIIVLGSGGLGPVAALADDSVLQRLEDMKVRLDDLRNRLEKEEATRLAMDQRLMALIAGLNIRFIHYRVDGTGNLTNGEGADFTHGNTTTPPLVVKKSENMFCAISKASSWARGDNSVYATHCEVARNAQNLWVITARVHSTCRVACVGVEMIRRDQ